MNDFSSIFHHHHQLLFSGQDSGGHSLRILPENHSSLQNRQLKSFSFPSRWFHGSFDCFRGPKVGIKHTAVDQAKVRWYISCSCARQPPSRMDVVSRCLAFDKFCGKDLTEAQILGLYSQKIANMPTLQVTKKSHPWKRSMIRLKSGFWEGMFLGSVLGRRVVPTNTIGK